MAKFGLTAYVGPKDMGENTNNADLDQTAHFVSSLIWVCIICSACLSNTKIFLRKSNLCEHVLT